VNRTFSQGRDTDWCADFVSTILEWAGGSPWGHLSRVQDIYEWGLANHRLDREPQPADVVVFSYGGSGFDHVALVESVNPDNTLTTIGGNEGYAISSYKTSGSVTRSVYKLDDKRILGFVDPVVPKGLSANPAR
jgi:surface antigen